MYPITRDKHICPVKNVLHELLTKSITLPKIRELNMVSILPSGTRNVKDMDEKVSD